MSNPFSDRTFLASTNPIVRDAKDGTGPIPYDPKDGTGPIPYDVGESY